MNFGLVNIYDINALSIDFCEQALFFSSADSFVKFSNTFVTYNIINKIKSNIKKSVILIMFITCKEFKIF
jgi:hypothetical protein